MSKRPNRPAKRRTLLRELLDFIWQNKLWVIAPVIIALLLLGHTSPALGLWTFGALAFATGLTGTVLARPFYLAWSGLARFISQTPRLLAPSIPPSVTACAVGWETDGCAGRL